MRRTAGVLVLGVMTVLVAAKVSAEPASPAAAAPAGAPPSTSEAARSAEQIVGQLEGGGATIRTRLTEARQARDTVKASCLSDKLTQMDVTIRSARERRDALAAASGRSDAELASHELTILTVLRQRGAQLSAEASQCIGIGPDVTLNDKTSVTQTIEPGMPDFNEVTKEWDQQVIVPDVPVSAVQ